MNRPVIVTLLTAVAVTGCSSAAVSGQASQLAGTATASASPHVQAAVLAAAPTRWGSRPPWRVTPGAAGHSRTAICPHVSAMLAGGRPGGAVVARVFAEYGIAPGLRHRYRIDQLVPLDLDGTDSIRNLWPQPARSFRAKNRLEARLHALVCSGRLTLAAAQRAIGRNWDRAYHRYLGAAAAPSSPPKSPPPPPPPPPPSAPATSPPPAAPPPPPASCHPLSSAGHCYEPGEFCSDADHGVTGLAGDGETIVCQDNDGWRWEPQ